MDVIIAPGAPLLTRYHEDILRQTLSDRFSPRALQAVVSANIAQDDLRGQIGHAEFHFDNNAFARSEAYIEEQRGLVRSALSAGEAPAAWAAFGRLTHTAQDFYAHSNYVDLWLASSGEVASPSPSAIEPLDDALLASPNLRSGRLYYPFEWLSFVPALKRVVLPCLPRDAHAWMNLDSPAQGPKFAYAFEAACARTRHEFDRTLAGLSAVQSAHFCDPGYPGESDSSI